jgi:hypothetical protein
MSLISWNLNRSYGQKIRRIRAVDEEGDGKMARINDRLLFSLASHSLIFTSTFSFFTPQR